MPFSSVELVLELFLSRYSPTFLLSSANQMVKNGKKEEEMFQIFSENVANFSEKKTAASKIICQLMFQDKFWDPLYCKKKRRRRDHSFGFTSSSWSVRSWQAAVAVNSSTAFSKSPPCFLRTSTTNTGQENKKQQRPTNGKYVPKQRSIKFFPVSVGIDRDFIALDGVLFISCYCNSFRTDWIVKFGRRDLPHSHKVCPSFIEFYRFFYLI